MNWQVKKFDELNVSQLYNILMLRSEVFVVEQNCIYQDVDDKDKHCYHIFLEENDNVIAYTRAIPPNIMYSIPSLGRVVVKKTHRHVGISQQLLLEGIKCIEKNFGVEDIVIHAQAHLEKFYNGVGFFGISEKFLEDDIPHIKMLKSQNKNLKFDKL